MRALLAVCLLSACGVVKDETATVSISPIAPKTDDDLVATVTGVDTFTLEWSKNGAARSDLAGSTVDHLLTTRGDLWHVDVVTPGGVVSSTETTIANTPPPAPVVHVTPDPPAPGGDVTCSVTATTPDADGDAITYSATWMKNGAPYATPTQTTFAGDTVAGADVKLDDNFQCTVTASDAIDTTMASSILATAQCATGGSMSFAVTGINETGTIQSWTVPTGVCRVTIEAGGAHGGLGNTNGAKMIGTFDLVAGTGLRILVGQQPTPIGSALAGGGGTFVVGPNNTPLVIAGGGGSNFSGTITDDELQGRIVTSGGAITGAARADNGAGGLSANATCGGGGGFLTDGAGAGGKAFVNGGAGNVGSAEYHAGFGGGGNRSGLYGEGGGGGYSGGSCVNGASTWVGCGGGGSINTGTNQANTPAANTGDGYVKITW